MKRVLIANRGEIALRAVRAARRNGLESVAVYSTADANTPAVWAADRAICIGPPAPTESYLDRDVMIEAARFTTCDAVYPGYGFLAEDAGFAAACGTAGLTFIGPSPEVIRTMGDKASARQVVAKLGVPIVPGSDGVVGDVDDAVRIADEIGYPVLLKAAAGGGGRGMRVVADHASLPALFAQANSEAAASFGDGRLYLERYFDHVRHIEIQVFGDRHGNYRHLWERDCSVQRRQQKLVEEAPSPVLDKATRRALVDAALSIAEANQYVNAGTVEFVYDLDSGCHFFIEMNTRIQVEHPVTEMLAGIDLVSEQFHVAAGQMLSFEMPAQCYDRSAIQWRICAEWPDRDFLPAPGTISRWRPPTGPGIRLDSHVYEGYVVPRQYDSLLAKFLVTGENRSDAIDRSRAALGSFDVEGVPTTLPFHLDLASDGDFLEGRIFTRWVESIWQDRQ